jgi:hypothetical protein
MRTYPHVLSEMETLDQVLAGKSIARYGDGEFKLCHGHSCVSQQHVRQLSKRLRGILHDSGACLVGIPNIHSQTPKAPFWNGFLRESQLLTDRAYVSSFITRPDSAPWIDTPEYWQRIESLWVGRTVTLVRGSTKSLVAEDLIGARTVDEVVCDRQHAFQHYDEILRRIGTPERVLLCLGPTATVLASDLCAKGVHAVDVGHIGLFLKKHRKGLPMWVTREDKGKVA